MISREVQEIFRYCSIFSALVPLILGFRNRATLLWGYPLVSFLFDSMYYLFGDVLEIRYEWLNNTFLLSEFLLISFIYRRVFTRPNALFYVFLTGGLGFFLATAFLSGNPVAFNVAGASLFSFTYIALGVAGLYSILRSQQVVFLEKSWFFWLNAGMIIYASGNFIIFLFVDYLRLHDPELVKDLWVVFRLLNISKNIFLAFALYFYRADDKQPE